MATYLIKTEPGTYSLDDLKRDKRTVWDGIGNNTALIHMRAMKKGDRVLIYHTGKEKQWVGTGSVTKDPYPDPKLNDPKRVVVDVAYKSTAPKPVTLAQIKADARFKDFALVKISRLSVMPVPSDIEQALNDLALS